MTYCMHNNAFDLLFFKHISVLLVLLWMKTVYFTSRSSYSCVRHQSTVWDGRSLKAAVYLKMPSITDSQGTRGSLECRGCVKVVYMFQGHTVHVTMFWAMTFDPSPTAAHRAARPTAAPCAEVTLKAWRSAVYILLLITLPFFTHQLTLVNLSEGCLALLWYFLGIAYPTQTSVCMRQSKQSQK